MHGHLSAHTVCSLLIYKSAVLLLLQVFRMTCHQRGRRQWAQPIESAALCLHSCWACWGRCTITSTSSVQLVTLVTSFNASDFSHQLIGGAPTLKMLKCSETQGITSSSTAKCNITTVPEGLRRASPRRRRGGAPPLILHCFFILFLASFQKGFSNDSGHSLGHHFYQKSEKRRFQCSMKRAYENGPGKNAVWEPFKPRKLAPRAGGSTILQFCQIPEKA